MTRSWDRLRLVAFFLIVTASAVACSGSGHASSSSSSGPTAEVQTKAQKIISCLKAGSITAATDPNGQLGVSDPFVRVVAHENQADPNTVTEIYLFESSSAASKNRFAITLSDTDTPTNELAGAIVVRFGKLPGSDYKRAVDGCTQGAG